MNFGVITFREDSPDNLDHLINSWFAAWEQKKIEPISVSLAIDSSPTARNRFNAIILYKKLA